MGYRRPFEGLDIVKALQARFPNAGKTAIGIYFHKSLVGMGTMGLENAQVSDFHQRASLINIHSKIG